MLLYVSTLLRERERERDRERERARISSLSPSINLSTFYIRPNMPALSQTTLSLFRDRFLKDNFYIFDVLILVYYYPKKSSNFKLSIVDASRLG